MSDQVQVYRRTSVQNLLACRDWENGTGEDAAFGEAFHDFAARYQRYLVAAGEETALAVVEKQAHGAFFEISRGLPPGRWPEFHALCDRFASTHVAGLSTLQGVEDTWSYDAGWARFTGTVDRWDRIDGDDPADPPRIIRIPDWKTSWQPEPHEFQGRFYAGLKFHEIEDLEEVHWAPDFVRLGGEQEVYLFEREETLAWFDDIIAGFRLRLEEVPGHPRGGPACQYCAHRYSCDQASMPWRELPENAEQLLELVGDFIRSTARHDELRDILKAGFSERDPIVLGPDGAQVEIGFLAPREERWVPTVPARAIAEAMDHDGLDGDVALKVDSAKVPAGQQRKYVEDGLAKMERGRPELKVRKVVPEKKRRQAVAS